MAAAAGVWRHIRSRAIAAQTALRALRLAPTAGRISRLLAGAVFVAIALTDRRGDGLLRAQRAGTIAMILRHVGHLRLRRASCLRCMGGLWRDRSAQPLRSA